MKYFITSNTNLLNSNKLWKDNFFEGKIKLDDYNKIFISLNNKNILSKHENFVGVIYLNDYFNISYKKFVSIIKKIVKKNSNKKFLIPEGGML